MTKFRVELRGSNERDVPPIKMLGPFDGPQDAWTKKDVLFGLDAPIKCRFVRIIAEAWHVHVVGFIFDFCSSISKPWILFESCCHVIRVVVFYFG